MNPEIYLRKIIFLALSVLLISPRVAAEVRLPQILGSNMVVQRQQEVKVWGWGDPREAVTVMFNGQTVKTRTSKDGKWMVALKPMEAGGPFTMTIRGKNTIQLENILIGDVWICSGQSNMEWKVADANNGAEEIMSASHPEIRLFDVPRNIQVKPVDDIPEASWNVCSPESVPEFSAVGYYFGRYLNQELGVPIGLVGSNWGGTIVETWMSGEMAAKDTEMAVQIEGLTELNTEELAKKIDKKKQQILAELGTLGSGMKDGEPVWADTDLSLDGWKEMDIPGVWEDKGLDGVDGVVWFRKSVTLTAEEAGDEAVLYLGPIDDSDETWVNGEMVGKTIAKYNQERIYRVPAGVLKEGVNMIAIRVEDYRGAGGIYGNPDLMSLKTSEGKIPLAGIWMYRVSAEGFKLSLSASLSPNAKPTLLYNGMIHPIQNFAAKGVIWYQGESNANRAYVYRDRFKNLILDWRNQWENPELGFYFVQLANFMDPRPEPVGSAWAELREAQAMALSLPETGMAVIIDIGDAKDIHPRNKQDVGKRLALSALHETYGKDVVYSGPVFKSMRVEGNKVYIEMDPMSSALVVKDKYGYVKGFAVAGEDQDFHWAKGYQDGNTIVLGSKDVDQPVAVRYAWADNPDDANIFNNEGLPAGPFRTDDWPGVTMEK